jgi:ERCC4-type nuclease
MAVKLKVDSREPPKIFVYLKRFKVDFVHTTLKEGDFKTEKFICERKTADDFVQSITTKRMIPQLQKILDKCKKDNLVGLLAISGDLEDVAQKYKNRGSTLNKNAIWGFISSTMVRYWPWIHVLWVRDDISLVYMVSKIAEKIHEGKLGLPRRPSVPRHTSDRRINSMMTLWRISRNQAESLLKRFNTIRGVLLATEKSLQTVPGIGPKIAKRIRSW